MKHLFFIVCLISITTLFGEDIPYHVNKKKFPLGEDFNKIMLLQIGNWSRFAFHDYIPGREDGGVYYQQGDKQIYVTFGKAVSLENMKTVWQKVYDNATDGKQAQVKQKNTASTTTKYLLMQGKSGFFYLWTRNLYYFSIQTKDKADADDFMKSFPW